MQKGKKKMISQSVKAVGRPLSFDPEVVTESVLMYFWKHGYARVAMDDLCRLCGLSKPSFYNLFGSKEDLFLRCFDLYNQRFVQGLLKHLIQQPDRKKGFQSLLQAACRQFQDPHLPTGCLAITGFVEVKGASKRIDSHLQAVQESFLKALVEYFGSKTVALFAIGQLYALAVFSRSNPDLFNFKDFMNSACVGFEAVTR